jgi:broad specificity phosphatase PhoE
MKLRVHYIRHGESQWNAEQSSAREKRLAEAAVRALADEPRFIDSPLSPTGVQQALALEGRYRAPEEGNDTSSLHRLLGCAASSACPAPTLFVSNLRRAIDTALFMTRPVLDAQPQLRVYVLPALQETCHHADCTPLPLLEQERLELPPLTAEEATERPTRSPVTSTVLAAQARALAAGASAADAEWLRNVGYSRLQLARHPHAYDDRRRVPDELSLRAASQLGDTDCAHALRPLTVRLGDIFTAALESAAGSTAARHPVVLTAHSRLLRELLFAFKSNRLTAPVAGLPSVALVWDALSNAEECSALGYDTAKLNNCGSVSFDLDLQMERDCRLGEDACDGPATLTLRQCVLGAGSVIVSRVAPALAAASAPSGPLDSHGEQQLHRGVLSFYASYAAILLLGLLGVLVALVARTPKRARSH